MAPRVSLGKCTDVNIPKMLEMYKAGKVEAGEAIVRDGKEYFIAPQIAHTHTTNAMGDVRKTYRLKSNGEWHLQDRTVNNERGYYSRRVDTWMNGAEDSVVVGNSKFIKQPDGTYLQPAYANYPARIVTSEEIEAAINYVKGKGSAENYTKLLRNTKN